MKVKPLGDKVLIKRVEAEEKTAGGLILAATAKEAPQLAEVIAVGPGETVDGKLVPMQVKVGDKVFFGKFSGTEIKIDGEEHIISEKEILAIAE
ncbi:MAG: co-chaperone GroES [Bacillota bacterium]|nr:co-chaperone GroES [Bacillota bacterium]